MPRVATISSADGDHAPRRLRQPRVLGAPELAVARCSRCAGARLATRRHRRASEHRDDRRGPAGVHRRGAPGPRPGAAVPVPPAGRGRAARRTARPNLRQPRRARRSQVDFARTTAAASSSTRTWRHLRPAHVRPGSGARRPGAADSSAAWPSTTRRRSRTPRAGPGRRAGPHRQRPRHANDINIGDNASVVRQFGGDYRNLGLDFGEPEPFTAMILYVDRVVRFPELIEWLVYVSDDPEGRDWGESAAAGQLHGGLRAVRERPARLAAHLLPRR